MKLISIQKVKEVSVVCSSFKRLIILYILETEPSGYSSIIEKFFIFGVKIGSSEMYKHLRVLLASGLISKYHKRYLITTKGMKFIDLINDLPEEGSDMKIGYIKDEITN